MSLEVPKFPRNQADAESDSALEELLHPLTDRNPSTFHTRNKSDYRALKEVYSKDKKSE